MNGITTYRDCEACGTPTPETDLTDVETVTYPLTVCPSCTPRETDHE
jgi:hypothetical protein